MVNKLCLYGHVTLLGNTRSLTRGTYRTKGIRRPGLPPDIMLFNDSSNVVVDVL